MLERKTLIDQIEIRRDGTVQVRLIKAILEDGEIISSQFHRTIVPPGFDTEATIADVNAHLAQMGEAEAEVAEWDRVRRVVGYEQTEDVVTAYREKTAQPEPNDVVAADSFESPNV